MIYFLTCAKLPILPPQEINAVNLLKENKFETQIVNWDEWNTDSLTENDTIFLRSTWNYDQKPHVFLSFLNTLKNSKARVINSVETMLWNMNKHYMFEFQTKNLAVIPTFHPFEKEELIHQFPETSQVIAKPIFSAGARGLLKLTKEEWGSNNLADSYICQPFVESVPKSGEWSLIYFDGVYSHSVLKKAKPGDFRVQSDHGGTVTSVDVPEEWKTQGLEYLKACPQKPFFARVDLVLINDKPTLIELEVIEPELFVTDSKANNNYCNAILNRIKYINK
jgi:glutathione synthase/RimK-type ligase-like ATP-grasp enzyme